MSSRELFMGHRDICPVLIKLFNLEKKSAENREKRLLLPQRRRMHAVTAGCGGPTPNFTRPVTLQPLTSLHSGGRTAGSDAGLWTA